MDGEVSNELREMTSRKWFCAYLSSRTDKLNCDYHLASIPFHGPYKSQISDGEAGFRRSKFNSNKTKTYEK